MKIIKPTVLVDKKKVLHNIAKMQNKADQNGVELRPHFKTHQSLIIGNWFREQGTTKITVSSISMARYFADAGWKDITIAIPVNILEINEINELSESVDLNLVVDSIFSTEYLNANLKFSVNLWIEIDTGSHRTGINPNQISQMTKIAEICSASNKLNLKGILSHAGQTYSAKSETEIKRIYQKSVNIMVELKRELERLNLGQIQISLGDTPTFTIIDSIDENIDEIRPGNYVFYDLMQHQLGVCTEAEIALVLVCPVISILPELNQVTIYGGGIHLSKENLNSNSGQKYYGKIVKLNKDNTWGSSVDGVVVTALSQEHGVILGSKEFIKNIKIGDLVSVLPIHSCMTANLHKTLFTTDLEEIDSLQF
ncbi:alanine racemase [Candidatus Lokiarchaeum ossiferum]|uniref:alanine racemase n=1 Tax=Candidatus Lokiarchaeum ossiferum TaxID=2951803 RepID=UPI00352CB65A